MLLKKLQKTISKDIADPLSLISASAKSILHNQELRKDKQLLENLKTILVASKIGLFKCWDLLEVMTDPATSNTEPEN